MTALSDPALYGVRAEELALEQTHISIVCLTPEVVYKIKKPVDLGFLDFTTLEKRRHFCEEEVRLNSRLSPEVYLGVVPLTWDGKRLAFGGEGEIVEYAVKMKRLPQERLLSHLLARDEVTPEMIEAVAAKVADFHERGERGPEVDRYGSLEVIRYNTEENFTQTEPFIGRTLSREQFEFLSTATRNFLRRNEAVFEERIARGCIRDCHGDLHTEHVCFADGLVIFDCIEFNTRFRCSDVAAEVAFLAMDLDAHDRPDLARHFVREYVARTGDAQLLWLLDFYKCYRAYVRGKVVGFQLDQPEVPPEAKEAARRQAQGMFALAERYAQTLARPVLFLLCGLMGTGKTALAQALAQNIDAELLRSDVVRKELAGLAPDTPQREPFEQGIYAPEFSRRTYEALRERAAKALRQGRGAVVLDASFASRQERQLTLALAQQEAAQAYVVECACPEEVVRQRLEVRLEAGRDASDGRWELYQQQRAAFEPCTEVPEGQHILLDTARPVAACLQELLLQLTA